MDNTKLFKTQMRSQKCRMIVSSTSEMLTLFPFTRRFGFNLQENPPLRHVSVVFPLNRFFHQPEKKTFIKINKTCSAFRLLLLPPPRPLKTHYTSSYNTNYSANYPRDDASLDPVSSLSGFAYVSRFPIYFYHGPLASSIGFSASRVCFI